MKFEQCRDNSHIAEENRKRFEIKRKDGLEIQRYRVDGCLFIRGSHDKRCDYFFEINTTPRTVFYVELKGKKIKHAVEQITATYQHVDIKTRHEAHQKKAFIVGNQKCPVASNENQKLLNKFKKEHFSIALNPKKPVEV